MRKLVFVLLFFYNIVSFVYGTGESSWSFLKIGGSGRIIGMGNAYSPLLDISEATYYNPAGIAKIKYPKASLLDIEWFADLRYNTVFYAQPAFGGVVGGSIMALYMPDFPLYNDQGSQTDQFLTMNSWGSAISYARIINNISFGANLKILDSYLMHQSSIGLAADIGFIMSKDNRGIGMSIQNIGINLQGFDGYDSLPLCINLHTGYDIKVLDNFIIKTSTEWKYFVYGDNFKGGAGVEFDIMDFFYLRTGYKIFHDINRWDVGAGLKYKESNDRFSLMFNYVFLPVENFSPVHVISMEMVYYPEKAEVYKTVIERKPPLEVGE